jgi:hypothetical protein
LSRFWRWHHLLVNSMFVTCNKQVSQIWNCTMHIHFVCYEFIEFIGLLLQIHKYTLGYFACLILQLVKFWKLEIEIVEPHFVKE